jgi:2-keto-4-pentenoate hydratase
MTQAASSTVARDTAAWLMQEHRNSARFVPFTAPRGITTIEGAYDVQREYVQLRRVARASERGGFKIGLTSKSMQAMCGIDMPVAGTISADQIHASGVTLRRPDYGRLGIEFEIAVRLGRTLMLGSDGSVSIDAVAAAIDGVCPAVEIVDDRHCDYKTLDVLSLIADNAWNAGIVLGPFVATWPDLSTVEGAVYVDGAAAALDTGKGSAVLGHPLSPVAWLAKHLAQTGESLRAGEIVMTGSMVTTKFPEAPGAWRFEVGGLGSVELQVL